MEKRNTQGWLMRILSATLNQTKPDASDLETLTPQMLEAVSRLAKKHDLAHIVSAFVYENQIPAEPQLRDRLRKEEILSVYRHEQMRYAFTQICRVLEQEKIAYIPLKGSVLRPYYPVESMRTSCDIDILVREAELDRAVERLQQAGFRMDKRAYHDVSLFSPNNIHLELHFSILENMDTLDTVLQDAWQYATPVDGYGRAFSEEFFAFHMLAHMSYHFLGGGCGLRSLMDLWVMEHKMGVSYLCAERLLRQAGILRFAEEMHTLAEKCFTRGDETVTEDPVLVYIIHGGVYGSTENHVAVKKEKTKSVFQYILQRVFMPYRSMAMQYPVLKKMPLLLPVYWIVRGVRVLLEGRGKKVISELSTARNTTDGKLEEIRVLRRRLGI